jgi:hypothetical protein
MLARRQRQTLSLLLTFQTPVADLQARKEQPDENHEDLDNVLGARDVLDGSGLCTSDQPLGFESREWEGTGNGKLQPEETARPHEEWHNFLDRRLEERKSEAAGYGH